MQTYDPQKAARVWQRVRGESASPASEENPLPLIELIEQEWTDATTYLHLSRQFEGKKSAALRKMAEQEQAHAACLKGIYCLTSGSRPAIRTAPPVRESAEITLRRCYGREMRCLAEYEARASDAQYGSVFQKLAEQEREHCRLVLELLGSLKTK